MGIREVAKLASVSTATVSRLITGAARVSPETASRVIDAMRVLNFEPNEAARVLAVQKKLKKQIESEHEGLDHVIGEIHQL
jgi:DNA-binding LacI/PurR family transcriptional regulator